MKLELTPLEINHVLRYDTIVFVKASFSVHERWAISLERSKMQNLKPDNRTSFIKDKTVKRLHNLHLYAQHWEDKEMKGLYEAVVK
jgi:hypothetical protein